MTHIILAEDVSDLGNCSPYNTYSQKMLASIIGSHIQAVPGADTIDGYLKFKDHQLVEVAAYDDRHLQSDLLIEMLSLWSSQEKHK